MSVLLYRYLILMKVHKVIPILSTFNLVVCVCLCVFSCVRLYTLWTIACQAPLSMEFSRQEYWIGLPFPSPWCLPNPGSNSSLLHCRQILYHLSYQGTPFIVEYYSIVCVCV